MTIKGQHVSEETKEKFRGTRFKNMTSKYNWEIAQPYIDTEINISSRNRKKKFITLREFKQFIEEDKSIKSIIKTGVSKWHIKY